MYTVGLNSSKKLLRYISRHTLGVAIDCHSLLLTKFGLFYSGVHFMYGIEQHRLLVGFIPDIKIT